MVNYGIPSAGCENCRRSKKSCDRKVPSCDRCLRLGKICGGYRDLGELMFRDQSTEVIRRASAGESRSTTTSPSTPGTPVSDDVAARGFFQAQFVTETFLPFLGHAHTDDHLAKSILACAYAGIANRSNELGRSGYKERARTFYIEALSTTNAALQHPVRMKQDSTLILVLLLALFERLVWDGASSVSSWKHHIQGAIQIVELRGRSQIRTRVGANLFRETMYHVTVNALWCETELPDFIIQWTHALGFEPAHVHSDQLAIIAARAIALKKQCCKSDWSDPVLIDTAAGIDTDLLAWSEQALATGSSCSYYSVQDPQSPNSWNGTRHEYRTPQAHKSWNEWRCLRIIVSRAQAALWRRTSRGLEHRSGAHDAYHYLNIRERMAADICIAVASALSNDASSTPPQGAIGTAYLCIFPLLLAGTMVLEHLTEPVVTPEGTRAILCNRPFHLDSLNTYSRQLAWVIGKLDFISANVGIRWAAAASSFLKGEMECHYDIDRSRITKSTGNEGILITETRSTTPTG